MKSIDKLFEYTSRCVAQKSSRRSWLAGLGGALVGAGPLPLLPVQRAEAASTEQPKNSNIPESGTDRLLWQVVVR